MFEAATTVPRGSTEYATQAARPARSYVLMASLAAALALYGYCLVRTAWLSDDAYITFRTVENFVSGYGLTWNTDERVQAYTHPLWMFLLSGLRLFSGEIYYTSLLASMALSAGAVLVLAFGVARTAGQALLAVTICAFSRAFVDYSTSGLENPLSYLLVGLFLVLYLRNDRALGSGDRGSGVGCRVSGVGCRVSGVGGRVSGVGGRVSGVGGRGSRNGNSENQNGKDSNRGNDNPAEAGAPNRESAEAGVFSKEPAEGGSPNGLLQLSLLAGLIVLNRMDLILLVGPALAHAIWRTIICHSQRGAVPYLEHGAAGCSGRGSLPRASEANRGEESGRSSLLRETRAKRAAKVAGLVLLGFAPFIAWEIFSIIYYGFPFPNTAYAKLNTGVPAGQLMRHGLDYLLDSLQADPLTLPAIGAAAAAALIWRDPRHIAIAAGIVLYLLYVVRIGGDFMSGRFLSVPLMFALGVLASVPAKLSSALWLSGALLAACAGLAGPRPSVLSTSVYGLCWTFPTEREPIVDERAFYYPETGLLRDRRGLPTGIERFKEAARQLKGRSSQVSGSATIGVYGYYMGKVIGPAAHVIDYYALADPLLARLPMKDDSRWRIGHFTRHVPDGYPERLHSDSNHLSDPNLDAFYDKLCLITRGPLFAWQRWRAIWAMNLGLYDHLIDREFYRHPPERVWLSQVNGGPKPRNVRTELARNADGAFVLPSAGFIVILGATSHATQLEIGLDGRQEYRIDYPQLGRFPVQQRIPAASPQSGQVVRRIDVPPDVAERGFDRFRILPVGGDGPYSLGFVRLVGDKTPTRDGT